MKKLFLGLLIICSLAHAGDVYRQTLGAYPFPGEFAGQGTTGTAALASQNMAVAGCWTMPIDDTITDVLFVNSSKTLTPPNDIYTVSIQSIDGSGNPGGVLGGGSPASRTFPNATYPIAGFGTNTSHIITLANSIALQAGTQYCTVIQHTGATDAANFLTLRNGNNGGGLSSGIPYTATADVTPTWTKAATFPMYWGIRSATRTYLYPSITLNTSQAIGGTTEAGFTFTIPAAYNSGNQVGVRGVRFSAGSTALSAAGTYIATLYSGCLSASPTTVQQTALLDSDIIGATTGKGIEILFNDDTLAALTPGTKYCIGIASSAAASSSIITITLPDAGSRDAWPLGGLTLMTRTLTDYPPSGNDTNAFSETTTSIVIGEVILGTFTVTGASSASMGGVF